MIYKLVSEIHSSDIWLRLHLNLLVDVGLRAHTKQNSQETSKSKGKKFSILIGQFQLKCDKWNMATSNPNQ